MPATKKYKPCPEGSVRNATTHRCRKIKSGTPKQKRVVAVRRRKITSSASSYKFPFANASLSAEKEKYVFPFANTSSMPSPTRKAVNKRGRMQGHHKGKLRRHVAMPKKSATKKRSSVESYLAAYGL